MLAVNENFLHRLAAIIDFHRLGHGRLFVKFRFFRQGRQRHRLRARRLHRHVAGLVFNLLECRLHVRVVRAALQHRLIFQNGRRELALLHVRLRDPLGRVDHVLLAPQFRVSLLENFQRLAIVRLRLHNNLEHLNRLQQLSFFALILCQRCHVVGIPSAGF